MFGALTKSAQIPFSSWLPAAIAAPTPVSSLVHSSTLVTAGVYVLIRFNNIFSSYIARFSFLFVITIFFAGLGACLENDIKKVVAMSTLRQLSFIILCISLEKWKLSFMHISFHAFFKSMLFLSTGFMMLSFTGTQDSRFFSGNLFYRACSIYMLISCMCLSGIPFLLGFYSKDTILVRAPREMGTFMVIILWLRCVLTISYRVKFFKFSVVTANRTLCTTSLGNPNLFIIPSLFLCIMCSFGGLFFSLLFLSDLGLIFRSMDYFIGVLLILMGVFVNFKKGGQFVMTFAMSMMFLFYTRIVGTSWTVKLMGAWFMDRTWMEKLTGEGLWRFLFELGGLFKSMNQAKFKYLIFLIPGVFLLLSYAQ